MSNEIELSTPFLPKIEFDYYDNCKNTTPSKTITLLVFLNWIKNGKVKDQIEDIRSTDDKDERSAKKKGLPAVTISGKFFPTRNMKNLIGLTGLIQIDIDVVEDLFKVLEWLKKDPYTLACFISPSGNGIKIIVRIPPDAKTHGASFRALRKYYREKYGLEIDDACSDVSRLFYLSYDPNIFVNTGALEYTELEQTQTPRLPKEPTLNLEDKGLSVEIKPVTDKTQPLNIDLDNKALYREVEIIIGRIREAEKDITASYKEWLSIGFAFAQAFKEDGRPLFQEVSRYYPQYSSLECDKQYNICLQGKGDGINIETFFFTAKKHGIDIKTNSIVRFANNLDDVENFPIRALYYIKKDNDGKAKDIVIQHTIFLALLAALGFRRFDLENGFTYVRVNSNVIEEVSRTTIQDVLFKYLKGLPEELPGGVEKGFLIEKFIRSAESYFSDTKLSLLEAENSAFCADNINEAFIFFLNGFVKCTKEGYDLRPYSELEGLVWKNQILNRGFEKMTIDTPEQEEIPVFAKFIENVSGPGQDRFLSLRTITGYLLHNQFEGKRRAVIFTDSDITDLTNGRTGKTLYAQALGKIRILCEINGKDFDPEERFKYQSVNLDTQIVHLNDVKKNFAIDKVFNDTTEGLTVEKKNKQPFRKDVKIILSTNKTVRVEGASAKDRVFEFEFVNHYNETFSPRDEFGKWFFGEGWTAQDWKEFDNFLCACLCLYLKEGIIRPAQINLNRRKLLESTNEDFVDFMDERVKDGRVKANELICKNELRNDFITYNPEYKLELTNVAKITLWLRNYANLSGYFAQNNSNQDEKKSGDKRYFVFRKLGYIRTKLRGFVPPTNS